MYLHVRVCVCTFVSIRRLVFLFAFPHSHGERLPLIISYEPAAVKGPSHSLSPERQMNIWSSLSLLGVCACIAACVSEIKPTEVSTVSTRLLLFSLFSPFSHLHVMLHLFSHLYFLHLHPFLFPFTSLSPSSPAIHFSPSTPLPWLLYFTLSPSSLPAGLCRDRGGQKQVLYSV